MELTWVDRVLLFLIVFCWTVGFYPMVREFLD